ncbi:hypothetical protein [Segniliparus rugosus]|uniref:Uncharacterized protein n=1 Tax=Segniliparus rugosus (strain ATCC BAA-974 / DSM 45345 / CCUG 50838 / CIP 108380 / JCM 13579 / CDC 945) TaxID=679197 RepID=E5XUT6_SEGRC|nr:hypothetical protein [Segniliparus rugosus]EFV11924.2 hypothetical protein HMPREF9336_03258 [Segniliparus rugosus ATCC BAA-974]
MAEGVRGGVSLWNIASAWFACVVAIGGAGAVLQQRPPSLWVAASLLLCAVAALAWAVARIKTRTPARGRSWRDWGAWREALDLWSWREYPYMIWFVCAMLAQQEFSRLYGFGWMLLILLSTLAPLAVWAVYVRRKRARAQVADGPDW